MTRVRRTTAVGLLVLAGGGALVLRLVAQRGVALGPLEAAPAVDRLSVRVGEPVHFSAHAHGGVRTVWSIWGRPMSTSRGFTYVPHTDEAGWQHVTVEIVGRDGTRRTRTWDVGVVPAVAPELVDVEPAPGPVELAPGQPVRFRSGARVPAARPTDRVRFEWLVDGTTVQRDEGPADAATSELALPPVAPGAYRLVLRVSEQGAEASTTAMWEVTVPGAEPAQVASATEPSAVPPDDARAPAPVDVPATQPDVPAPSASREPEPPKAPSPAADLPAAPPPPARPATATTLPPEAPAPTLVRAPGSRRIDAEPGDRITLRVTVLPPDAPVRYAWTVDGKRLAARGGELALDAGDEPATKRVAVRVSAAGREIGRDAWTVGIRAPRPVREEPVVAPGPPPVVAPSRKALDEAEIRLWLDEYARAWSRKDTAALRRMGQIRSPAEATEMQRYFQSIDALRVDLRVRAVRVAGERASVEFERTDTVTDPSGREQQLRLPPMRKEIERTPDGLRFVARDGAG